MIARVRSVALIPALSVVLALLVGAMIMILTSPLVVDSFSLTLPLEAYVAMISGAFGSLNGIVNTFANATPLLLAGLGIGIGFKGGLFNIGGPGQMVIGALVGTTVALALNDASPIVAIPAALIGGMVGGAIYGFIPGALKAFTGAHEVVVTIMLNFVAFSIISWAVSGPLIGTGVTFARTDDIQAAALPVIIGRNGHLGILVAAVAVPIVYWLLYRSTTGFEIRTTGANPDAARYAGMRPRGVIVLTMSLAGLFAGLAGIIQILGPQTGFLAASYTAPVGFEAIAVALLGRAHPVGIMFAALLFGAMQAGTNNMQILGLPPQMVDILQAVILLFITADIVVRRVFRVREQAGELVEIASVSRSYGGGGTGTAGT
ncbi:MAG TPA: ABC transporter permease [Candidatus Limnocylindria bacterium]|nr:ABC transporter permease [Candidatus Limnocylindria bacterium]